jgi:hypothetical protein
MIYKSDLMIEPDFNECLSKGQHLKVAFGKKITFGSEVIITTNGGDIMGTHYDYKSTRGAKKMAKQQQRDERRRRRKKKTPVKQQNTVPEDVVLTLDMITAPEK